MMRFAVISGPWNLERLSQKRLALDHHDISKWDGTITKKGTSYERGNIKKNLEPGRAPEERGTTWGVLECTLTKRDYPCLRALTSRALAHNVSRPRSIIDGQGERREFGVTNGV